MTSYTFDRFAWLTETANELDLSDISSFASKIKAVLTDDFKQAFDENGDDPRISFKSEEEHIRIVISRKNIVAFMDSIAEDQDQDTLKNMLSYLTQILSLDFMPETYTRAGILAEGNFFPNGANEDDKKDKYVLHIGNKILRPRDGRELSDFNISIESKMKNGAKNVEYGVSEHETGLYSLSVKLLFSPIFVMEAVDGLSSEKLISAIKEYDPIQELRNEFEYVETL